MNKASFTMKDRNVCMDCSFALKRFIGGLDGVDAVEVEEGAIVVSFDEQVIAPDRLAEITKDSIRKLGYDLKE